MEDEQPGEYYDELGGEAYVPDPYTSNYQIDGKLISSDYKDQKMIFKIPTYKKILVTTVFKDKFGVVKKVNGKPVEKTTYYANVLTGFEDKQIDFPVPNLHNDSVTSSILTDSDVDSIRMIDDNVYDLSLEMMTKANVSFVKSIYRLNGLKASIVDSAKGRWGRSAELAKTQITKGESKTFAYHDQRSFDEYEKRKNRKGIFGFGVGPL